MTEAAALRSGKGAGDENFPVASWLIKARHRPAILAFYEFVRTADDIADHPSLGSAEKLARLDELEASLLGSGNAPEGVTLAKILQSRNLSSAHARDLLRAFRQDVVKRRYADWAELMDYCALSAMPVGRFVLDVHGEQHANWPASDALCAALQIINHLQDCGADYRNLDRVYIPMDALAARGIEVDALGQSIATSPLRDCLRYLAERTGGLLRASRGLADSARDTRLAMEISTIQAVAERLTTLLQVRDPLSETVKLTRGMTLTAVTDGISGALFRRAFRKKSPVRECQTP